MVTDNAKLIQDCFVYAALLRSTSDATLRNKVADHLVAVGVALKEKKITHAHGHLIDFNWNGDLTL